MKKILYIVSTLKRSGPTNQLFNIISNLEPEFFKPILITLSPEPEDSRWLDYESLGIEMYSLNLSRLGGVFLAKTKLKSLISRLQPDLIHTQGVRADILSSQLDISPPRIATIRNFPQVDFLMTYGRIMGTWMTWRQVRALKHLNLAVGVSKAVKNNLEKRYHLSNTAIVQNGVDTLTYKPLVEEIKSSLRSKLGLPVDSKIWVVSGHLSERKDPLFLIKLWGKVTAIDNSNVLVYIGSGPLESKCRDLASKVGNIKVLGRVNNVAEYLKVADFYVSPSVAEGLPNAALEAMACGLPVLLSDIEPHKEIYNMSPEIGFLFKLGEEHSFLESFKELVESDYSIHRQAALDLIKSELSAVKMSQKYQNTYNDLIGDK
ncbi:glycosyltransferase [Vibrio cincinnatiensis]|uniref:glycosyltransferase family 4 protein n=1 Tax=Vibrio cincinnatiensis TaxID=675 RepID=UPI001EE13EED|nr:glycosyltransferase family 4 protein [Vibrio cincinnatiensis]MCG3767777.1 glycosyltransferase [Vibrio cincinnatiensis]